LGLLIVIFLHGLYDFPLLAIDAMDKQGLLDNDVPGEWGLVLGLFIFFLAVFIFEIAWTVKIVRRLRREQAQVAAPRATN
jgi:hypothetical protein